MLCFAFVVCQTHILHKLLALFLYFAPLQLVISIFVYLLTKLTIFKFNSWLSFELTRRFMGMLILPCHRQLWFTLQLPILLASVVFS